jgi:hypothetical protein
MIYLNSLRVINSQLTKNGEHEMLNYEEELEEEEEEETEDW